MIEVSLNGGKFHWLSPAGRRPANDAIHQKHRARHNAEIRANRKPVSDEARVKAEAIDEGIREAHAYSRHRHKHRISHAEIAARHEGMAEARGYHRHRRRQAMPYKIYVVADIVLEPNADPTAVDPPVKLQLVAWAKALMVLDRSEILVRDMIERDLADKTGAAAAYRPMRTLVAAQTLAAKIRDVRDEAFKTAFRMLRDRLGNGPVLTVSLAAWAAYFAREDNKNIVASIQAAIVEGVDSPEIARRIVGTLALNGVDGVTEYTRHKIAHLGRASIKQSNLRMQGLDPDGEALNRLKGLDPGR